MAPAKKYMKLGRHKVKTQYAEYDLNKDELAQLEGPKGKYFEFKDEKKAAPKVKPQAKPE